MPLENTGSEALSIDQAVGLLTPKEPDEQQPPGVDSAPADATGAEAPTGSDSDQNADPDEPAIAAPRSWNAEARAKFAELPRDIQETIATRESEREGALTKAQQDSAEARRRADTEVQAVGQLKTQLDMLLPKAEEMFAHRWAKVDWAKVTDSLGAEETLKLKHQYETEQDELQRLRNAMAQTNELAFQKYVQSEGERLKTLAPDLVDPKEGLNRRGQVGQFLIEHGFTPMQIQGISASALSIAYDALRYRAAQKNLGKQPAPALKPVVKPAGGKPSATPQKQKVQALKDRAFSSGRIDDMVALLDAEGST